MKNKGITLIEMVVVVLILILIAIIAIWSSKKTTIEAETAVIFSELKAVHTGVLKVQGEYNAEIIEDYKAGEQYNTECQDASGIVIPDWYIIYGMTSPSYSETVLENLGIDELKRDYKVNFKEAKVEFLNGPVSVGEYEINSYDEMLVLMESGAI